MSCACQVPAVVSVTATPETDLTVGQAFAVGPGWLEWWDGPLGEEPLGGD
jgi:hypothetical protein